jgi:N6-L-threonylcarbamoyladenine synthase
MLGLGYPGGPAVERLARSGDPARFALPRPLAGTPGCDFSFSGLKTAVRHQILALGPAAGEPRTLADLCASFQAAVGDVLVDRVGRAIRLVRVAHLGAVRTLVLAGGVAANLELRRRLEAATATEGFDLVAPPLALCTDNAAMVAWAGLERLAASRRRPDDQAVAARARWPLEELTPP